MHGSSSVDTNRRRVAAMGKLFTPKLPGVCTIKSISRVYQEYIKSISRVYQECIKSISRVYQEYIKSISRVYNHTLGS